MVDADVPRRLPPEQNQRIRALAVTRGALSGKGRTASARPVGTLPAAQVWRPEPWAQTYSSPGTLAVVTGTARIYNETNRVMGLGPVHAAVDTAPTGAAVILDVKLNGASVFASPGDRPTIAAGGHDVTVTPPRPTFFAPGDYVTVDVVQVGSTIPGGDLTVQVRAV